MPAERLQRHFGGLRPLARAIGRAPSTVQRWTDYIPMCAAVPILLAGQKLGKPVGWRDFFPPEALALIDAQEQATKDGEASE